MKKACKKCAIKNSQNTWLNAFWDVHSTLVLTVAFLIGKQLVLVQQVLRLQTLQTFDQGGQGDVRQKDKIYPSIRQSITTCAACLETSNLFRHACFLSVMQDVCNQKTHTCFGASCLQQIARWNQFYETYGNTKWRKAKQVEPLASAQVVCRMLDIKTLLPKHPANDRRWGGSQWWQDMRFVVCCLLVCYFLFWHPSLFEMEIIGIRDACSTVDIFNGSKWSPNGLLVVF